MQRAAREREEDAEKARRLADLRTPKEEKESGGWNPFRALKGRGLQQCETSYDCDAPMVCCDLLFAQVCCTGGMLIPTADRAQQALQRQAIPIPVERDGPVNGPANTPPQYPDQPF